MASGDRFYQLDLRHRPAVWGDIGNLLKIEGVVVGGEDAQTILMLPGAIFRATDGHALTPEEWTDWLQRSDNPEVLINGSLEKAFHRKLRYEISGAVQQKVWVADGYKCMYCWAEMGKAVMTIDHFTPLEMGGTNDTSNYLSACRRCNKNKGGMAPRDWCEFKRSDFDERKMDYDWYVKYLANRIIK